MKLVVKYFAAMREQAGLSEEVIETQAQTPEELLNELVAKHGFDLSTKHLKVAINEEYESFTMKLSENDTVVFIPPVAGG